jgi:hypothetical protein
MAGESLPIEQEQQMLNALEDSISIADYEFSTQLAHGQSFFDEVEMARYMEGGYIHADDPIEKIKWQDALRSYLNSLGGYDFDEDERLDLDEIKQNLHAETEAVGEEPKNDWETESFCIDLSYEEISEIRQTAACRAAEAYANRSVNGVIDLVRAYQAVAAVDEKVASCIRRFLDHYVFEAAESHAAGNGNGFRDLSRAKNVINFYASSEAAVARMRSAIDKHVFTEAESRAVSDTTEAQDII